MCPLTCRYKADAGPHPQGFSLLEMMMVVTLILIVASIGGGAYVATVFVAMYAPLGDAP
jgi:prepilin-type N-terminal cleavage/methylation domain-containing protein